jgi:predicted transposase YbfD/YdcC
LKANRHAALADVEAYFADPKVEIAGTHETIDADHGRLETGRHTVVHNVVWLFPDARDPDRPAMPGLGTIARVEAEVERDGRITRSTRHYLSSAGLAAQRFAQAVRAHRGIENGVPRVLDTAFDEDRARNRKDHGAENLALNVLKRARPAESESDPDGPRLRPIPPRPNAMALGQTLGSEE